MHIVGLNLQATNVPGVLWKDTTGPTGVLTLTSDATFSNITRYTLYVWAIARHPSSTTAVQQTTWSLGPGTVTVYLPSPPQGTYWTLYTQTDYQHNYGAFLKWAGFGSLVGPAFVGARTLIKRSKRCAAAIIPPQTDRMKAR